MPPLPPMRLYDLSQLKRLNHALRLRWPVRLFDAIDNLPKDRAVYLITDDNDRPLYVGSTVNLRGRIITHCYVGQPRHGQGLARYLARERGVSKKRVLIPMSLPNSTRGQPDIDHKEIHKYQRMVGNLRLRWIKIPVDDQLADDDAARTEQLRTMKMLELYVRQTSGAKYGDDEVTPIPFVERV